MTAYTTSHLVALMDRLSRETERHGSNPNMQVYLNSICKEIADEEAFLAARGVNTYAGENDDMTIDDIMAELAA